MRTYSTHEVAQTVGVHKETILRWLREGRISEPSRDRNGWRLFTEGDLEKIKSFADIPLANIAPTKNNNEIPLPYEDSVKHLCRLDWSFDSDCTNYSTHGLHPYPAKFIPQIPKTLIRELASSRDTVLDPFCGSGTTLVEALKLNCNAIGIDASPLACMISRAKACPISDEESQKLGDLAQKFIDLHLAQEGTLFENLSPLGSFDPTPYTYDGVEEWFTPQVIKELAFIKKTCNEISSEKIKLLALTVFSSIIVSVSLQDSDTRYVRRDKKIAPGETLQLFGRHLLKAAKRANEFAEELDPGLSLHVHCCNILNPPAIQPVDLVVCSPPYPNAYSYHLYHRSRMLWLGMDQPTFKKHEIGSHRKYSSKSANAATIETFKKELEQILVWLSAIIKKNRHACFVLGDSTIRGTVYQNDLLLIDLAKRVGFTAEANIERKIKAAKKSFNPSIGKIKTEHIVVLRNEKP